MYNQPEDLARALRNLPSPNMAWRAQARARQNALTKPSGALGRLEEIAVFLAGWGNDPAPKCDNVAITVFAANHGVTIHDVSAYPAEVTAQMVHNFRAGGAAINVLARTLGAELKVEAIDIGNPTGDISVEPALSELELLEALQIGEAAVDPRAELLLVGEMGIGNSTIAAALAAAAFGGTGADWAGPGTGVDRAAIARKAALVDSALARLQSRTPAAFETLRQLGGRETAAIAGAVLAARRHRIPVILDGFVATAAVAPLYAEAPGISAHLLAGHVSAEPAHARLLQNMALRPLLALDLRLGEGSGAALAAHIVRAAVATHNEMATFQEAGVATHH